MNLLGVIMILAFIGYTVDSKLIDLISSGLFVYTKNTLIVTRFLWVCLFVIAILIGFMEGAVK